MSHDMSLQESMNTVQSKKTQCNTLKRISSVDIASNQAQDRLQPIVILYKELVTCVPESVTATRTAVTTSTVNQTASVEPASVQTKSVVFVGTQSLKQCRR